MHWNNWKDNWKDNWKETLACINKIGGDIEQTLIIEGRTSEEELASVEAKLGMRLPAAFRNVLKEFSSKVNLSWNLPSDFILPEELKEIFAGELHWSLDELLESEEARQSWVEECFSDESNEYDKVWHNKLGFISIANGDIIAFDLANHPVRTPIVYLSHDEGEGHGYVLGEDFIDFINNLTFIGCVGLEEWQFSPFYNNDKSTIDVNCRNAKKWREIIGMT